MASLPENINVVFLEIMGYVASHSTAHVRTRYARGWDVSILMPVTFITRFKNWDFEPYQLAALAEMVPDPYQQQLYTKFLRTAEGRERIGRALQDTGKQGSVNLLPRFIENLRIKGPTLWEHLLEG